MIDPVDLTKRLIACNSVTPARGEVFDVLEAALVPIGFAVERFVAGESPDGPVENLLATRGTGSPHLAFAGHVDVVPPGEGWTAGAFTPQVHGDLLYGRGAVDMKGAIAAFVAAASETAHAGQLTLVITGDEEGPATYGTVALIDRMRARGIAPDLCLVGEPTSTAVLGDMVKIGRRGSVNVWIEVPGRQGHVAYPHLADNPIPRLVAALADLDALVLDEGTDWFQPSNLEITDVTVGNPATNVIPARAAARLSIRFNDRHTGQGLADRVAGIVHAHAPEALVTAKISGEAFLTPPGRLSALVSAAIEEVTGRVPELSTTGGTSDARFLRALCPVVEFGLLNATMHKLDEAVAVADLHTLTAIYAGVIRRAGAGELRRGVVPSPRTPARLGALPTAAVFDVLATRLDPTKAGAARIAFVFPERSERVVVTVANGVLTHRIAATGPADATLTMARAAFLDSLGGGAPLAGHVASGAATIEGDGALLARFAGWFDAPDPNFAIVTP